MLIVVKGQNGKLMRWDAVKVSSGAVDANKFVVTTTEGKVDGTLFDASSIDIGELGISESMGVIDADKVIKTNSVGLLDNSFLNFTPDAIDITTGAPDAGKLIQTDSLGLLDDSFLPFDPTSVDISTGSGDAEKLVRTDENGKIDNSFLNFPTAVPKYSEVVTVTATRDLNLSDNTAYLHCTNSSSITLTIRLDSSVNYPIGSEIEVARNGTEAVVITRESGVTMAVAGVGVTTSLTIFGQYYLAMLKKVAANSWVVYGDV
ncbi:MAG: hypothetical protein HC773_00870 [Scytonema sp. CRU_2_7]|nr:hypothetical protein [Scytonema sp. CRU_2_7]